MVEISRLLWKGIYTADQIMLGDVEGVEFDANSWQITGFYVGLTDKATNALEFKRPFMGKVVVCLPISVVGSFKETVILNKTLEENC